MKTCLVRKKFGPCPKCKAVLLHHCIRNGVRIVMGGEEEPTHIWNADLYRCPGCGSYVLTDFGIRAEWTKKNTPDIKGMAARLKEEGDMVVFAPVGFRFYQVRKRRR